MKYYPRLIKLLLTTIVLLCTSNTTFAGRKEFHVGKKETDVDRSVKTVIIQDHNEERVVIKDLSQNAIKISSLVNMFKGRQEEEKVEKHVALIRVGMQDSVLRFVIDTDEKPEYIRQEGNSIILNLNNGNYENIDVELSKSIPQDSNPIREMSFKKGIATIVFDPKYRSIRSFTLPKSSRYEKHRSVFDIAPQNITIRSKTAQDDIQRIVLNSVPFDRDHKSKSYFEDDLRLSQIDKPTIVIDAGHGGKDPGAIGSKYKEKDINLKYALELYKLLKSTKMYNVYLTRSNDTFVSLEKRRDIAQDKQGDLFISLHADSSPRSNVSGMSLYTLDKKANKKIADKMLQDKKRYPKSTLNGVDFTNKSAILSRTFIDMSQRSSSSESVRFGNIVLQKARKNHINILRSKLHTAQFAVLKRPDFPSVLIEIGFMSNPKEERLIHTTKYRKKFTKSLVMSINEFFDYKVS